MRLGVLLPHRAVVLQSARRPPLEVCWTVARMCDEAGLDLWVGDSVVAKPRLELEEHIVVWRKLWSGQTVTYTGNDVKLTEHTIGPLPWHEAGPPILITAGNRGEIIPAQLERFARLGDGIITTYLTDDDCRTLRARCEEVLAQHGRSLQDFPMCVYTTVRLDADVAQAETLTRAFLEQYYGGGIHYRGLMGLGPASL